MSPEKELEALREAFLLRQLIEVESCQAVELMVNGEQIINFASNDYLGLSSHPLIKEAFKKGIDLWGAGAGSSRLITGSQSPHLLLEEQIAKLKGKQAAKVFSNGYAASVGVLSGLLSKEDVVILDKLTHASLIDGARLSGATLRVFPHNDIAKLEKILATYSGHQGRIIVVTESVFSMDGDLANLEALVALKKNYPFLLLLDEAHGVGVVGPLGQAHQLGFASDIDLHMGTLGKAAGVAGGYVACSQSLSDLIVNKARSFIYSTAPPAAQCVAASEALKIINSEEGTKLRNKLWSNIEFLAGELQVGKMPTSAIIPWHVGSSEDALTLHADLKSKQLLVPAVRYPTVPRHTARLRITVSAAHSEEQLRYLAEHLKKSRFTQA